MFQISNFFKSILLLSIITISCYGASPRLSIIETFSSGVVMESYDADRVLFQFYNDVSNKAIPMVFHTWYSNANVDPVYLDNPERSANKFKVEEIQLEVIDDNNYDEKIDCRIIDLLGNTVAVVELKYDNDRYKGILKKADLAKGIYFIYYGDTIKNLMGKIIIR